MRTIIGICLLALVPTWVLAADAKIPGYEGKTKRVIERAFREYRSFKSYQDRLIRKTEYEADGDVDALPPALTKELESSFSYTKPGQFIFDAGARKLTCDAKHIWISMPKLHQYTETEAPKEWTVDAENADSLSAKGVVHRPASIVLTKLPPEKIFQDVIRFDAPKSAKREGHDGTIISGTMRVPRTKDIEVHFEYWFNDKTGLLEDSVSDMTASMAASIKHNEESYGVKIKKVSSHIRYVDIKTNQKTGPDAFAFKPDAEDEKVEKFGSNIQDRIAKQQNMVDKPAPEFKGQSLDGKELSLADFKGKVVMLDFWATWCGPCVAFLPTVQKLSERFADKDVVILGMNCDEGNAKKAVSRFVSDKKVTFPQFLNAKEKAMEPYGVVAIPCSVFIDRQGVVRAVETGGHEEELVADMIDALLEGKSIADAKKKHEAKDAEEKKDEKAEDTKQAAAGRETASIKETTPDRLKKRDLENGPANLGSSKEIDVDGDGRMELVASTRDGKLVVIGSKSNKVETIEVSATAEAGPLVGFAAARSKEGTRWFTANGAPRKGSGSPEAQRLSYHEANGKQLWDFAVETVKDQTRTLMVDAGDLDGDGAPELVAAVTIYKAATRGALPFSRTPLGSQLMIFNESGKLLSSRNVGPSIQKLQVTPAKDGAPGQVLVVGERGSLAAYTLEADSPAAKPASN